MITQTVDDTIVMSLDVHGRNPVLMWQQLAADYNTVTPAQRLMARKYFLKFRIDDDETFLVIKQRINVCSPYRV